MSKEKSFENSVEAAIPVKEIMDAAQIELKNPSTISEGASF